MKSDVLLLSRLKNGDQVAFTEIYERYWRKLLLVAWNHTRDKVMAEDIVHEVFLSLWERRTEVDVRDLEAFLATAVKFSVFKFHQKEQHRGELINRHYRTSTLILDEEKLDALFLKEYIDGIVERMPEKCRLVFQYSREMGMKNHEIAREMNISEKGVEANLTRALKIIRNSLKNNGVIILLGYYFLNNRF